MYMLLNSGFLDILEHYDTVMTDCGFKIKPDLTFHRFYLAIPPCAVKRNQMASKIERLVHKTD